MTTFWVNETRRGDFAVCTDFGRIVARFDNYEDASAKRGELAGVRGEVVTPLAKPRKIGRSRREEAAKAHERWPEFLAWMQETRAGARQCPAGGFPDNFEHWLAGGRWVDEPRQLDREHRARRARRGRLTP